MLPSPHLPLDTIKKVHKLLRNRGHLCFEALRHLDGYVGSAHNAKSDRYGFMGANPAIKVQIVPLVLPVVVFQTHRLDSWDLPALQRPAVIGADPVISLVELHALCGDGGLDEFLLAHGWTSRDTYFEEESPRLRIHSRLDEHDTIDDEVVYAALWDLFELQFNRVGRIVVHLESDALPDTTLSQ